MRLVLGWIYVANSRKHFRRVLRLGGLEYPHLFGADEIGSCASHMLPLQYQRMGTTTSALADRRKAKRLTQEHLAAKAGLTARTVRAIERGEWQPRFATQWAIANALDCHPDDLWPHADGDKRSAAA